MPRPKKPVTLNPIIVKPNTVKGRDRIAQLKSEALGGENISREIITPAPVAKNTDEIHALDINQVFRSELNPRKHFDEKKLNELAESIKAIGQREAIRVRPYPGGQDGYLIVTGERRWRACKLAGLTTVRAVIDHEMDDATHTEFALIENLHRADLDPIEEARGYQKLQELGGYTQKEVAAKVNRTQPAIANAMRSLKLPENVLEKISTRELSVSHGIQLLRFEKQPVFLANLALRVIKEDVPVRKLEKGVPFLGEDPSHIHLREYNTPFDWKKICPSCPYGAYVEHDKYSGACFNPEHYNELVDEEKVKKAAAAKKLKAKMEKQIEKQGASGKIDLAFLNGSGYEVVRDPAPDGCSADCECRRLGSTTHNGEFQVCIKPAKFRELRDNSNAARIENLRTRSIEDLATLQKTAAGINLRSITSRELMLILWPGLEDGDPKYFNEAFARHGIADRTDEQGWGIDANLAEFLAGLPPAKLLRIAAGYC